MSKNIEATVIYDRNFVPGVTHETSDISTFKPESFTYEGDSLEEIIELIKKEGSERCKKHITQIEKEINRVKTNMTNETIGEISEKYHSISILDGAPIEDIFLGYESTLQFTESDSDDGEFSRYWLLGKNVEEGKSSAQTCLVELNEPATQENISSFQALSIRWRNLPNNLKTMITLHST